MKIYISRNDLNLEKKKKNAAYNVLVQIVENNELLCPPNSNLNFRN